MADPRGGNLLGVGSDASTSTVLLALAGAFAVGLMLAKVVDWMGHGHPTR